MKPKTDPPTDVGVIIGRFQVDELHDAHIDLIQSVIDRHDKIIIFLGLSPIKCTYNNPLDFESRKQMILEKFPAVIVLYIKDVGSDRVWSKNLDEKISDVVGPHQTVSLYGSRSSFIGHYNGQYNCIELEQTSFISGSSIRKKISNKVKSSPEFRGGVIWCTMNQYINATPCVDIAIFNDDGTKVLLARKPNEYKFRFIGGHVNAGENFERAAKREVSEETSLEVDDISYVGSCVVDDWRHRSEKSDITTCLFRAKRVFGKPEAKDDIEELRWFDVENFNPETILVKEHIQLAEMLSIGLDFEELDFYNP